MAQPFSERELREIAEGPLHDEVIALCAQVRELRHWTAPGGLFAPVHEALLEAPLLHILVLDDFLGTPPDVSRGDVGAQDYLPGRSPAPVLTRVERVELEAQLHMGRPRRPLQEWDHEGITRRVCEAFVGLAQSLDRHPEPLVRRRGEWFVESGLVAHGFELEIRTGTRSITQVADDARPRSEPFRGWR